VLAQVAAGHLRQPVPEDQRVLQLGTPQVQVAMAQAQLLRGQRRATRPRDGDRRRLRGSDDAQGRREHLDVAGRQLRVPRVGSAHAHLALDQHHALDADRGRQRHVLGRRLRAEGDLHDPVAVAQVHEDQGAQVTAALHPTAQANALPRVLGAQGTAGVGSERRGGR
jgi:hypothetical protein